ncbi:MAG: hypothetical protein IMF12_07200 [Proteobacteria bacterium]|nr:hypothetical protein [Pseudomonadota bacterium]
MMQHLIRRDFFKLSLIPFFAIFFGCSRSQESIQDIDTAIKEAEFSYFLNVIFPINLLGFHIHQEYIIKRLKSLNTIESEQVVKCYNLFKSKYQTEYSSFNSYTLAKGEAVIAQLLTINSKDSKTVNPALDIIYEQISRIEALQNDLWGRKYSKNFMMCAYWDDYDKPVATNIL